MATKIFRLPQNKILRLVVLLFLSLFLLLLILGLIRQWIVRSEVALEPLLPDTLLEFPTDLAEIPSLTPPPPPKMAVTEKLGKVKYFIEGAPSIGGVVLDLTDRVDGSTSEEGLLGIAFHPNFQNNQYFYLFYTAKDPLRIRLSRFTFLPETNTAEASSEKILIEIPKQAIGHNGGQMVFGPDGFLYVSIGEEQIPPKAQNLQTLFGKILRLDVSDPDSAQGYAIPPDNPFVGKANSLGEIWAYGFRNPWRFSFDRETGHLYVGDVGHDTIEEINFVKKGENYGWPLMEGVDCHASQPECDPTGLSLPIGAFPRLFLRVMIGGYVYRGQDIAWLQGNYVFADFFRGLFSIPLDPTQVAKLPDFLLHEPVSPHPLLPDQRILITSLAEDRQGELYVVDFRGAIYKIVDDRWF